MPGRMSREKRCETTQQYSSGEIVAWTIKIHKNPTYIHTNNDVRVEWILSLCILYLYVSPVSCMLC